MSSKVQSSPINQKVIITAVIISVICLMLFLQNYFILITLAAILAFLFNPIYRWFLVKFKDRKGSAVSMTVVVMFITVAIPVSLLITVTVAQAIELVNNIQSTTSTGSFSDAVDNAVNSLNDQAARLPFVSTNPLSSDKVISWLQDNASTIINTSVDLIKGFAGGIANFFTMLIIFLFVFSSLLKNQEELMKMLNEINPLGETLNKLYLKRMGDMTSAMVKGQFAIAVAQGLSGTLSLWIIGFDYLAFWFFLLTFLSIIPLGGGIILIPLGIVLILTGNVWQGVFLLAWHFIITTNIDNIMRPKFVPKSARMDPALTILSVFAGIGIFGFLGIVIGPVIMIVILSTIQIYLEYKRKYMKA